MTSWDVPGYKVVEFLGHGAFGEVRLGYDKQTNRKVSNIEVKKSGKKTKIQVIPLFSE